ncbi:hypothetical protein Z948_3533 [Sulfitobacter donghicola DSW-25 = KCTC 12864 = JCM 14565]|nr:hypothetical protein Z948_3533 [Sulfitobacter donghicola DSW-25 = KCTC 12864 = JCM 14565]
MLRLFDEKISAETGAPIPIDPAINATSAMRILLFALNIVFGRHYIKRYRHDQTLLV